MPWCPKCKNEYKDGYTVCADCKTELVASLKEESVPVYFGEEARIKEICDFMSANGINETEVIFDEKESTYELFVPKKQAEEAMKQIRVYLTNIAEPRKLEEEPEQDAMKEVDTEESQELYTTPYQEADKKAEEYKSGADSLILVGILGIIMLVLLNFGVIPIALVGFTKTMITLVMGVMFLIFLVLGITSRSSYKKLVKQAGVEKDQKAELKSYLKDAIQPGSFDAEFLEDNPSMEILYFRRNEKMKELLKKNYPDLDVSFMEYIIEETYPEIFE